MQINHKRCKEVYENNEDPYSWLDEAPCDNPNIDPDIFTKKNNVYARIAKRMCKSCVVREICLDKALKLSKKEDVGIKAGLTVQERDKIRPSNQDNEK